MLKRNDLLLLLTHIEEKYKIDASKEKTILFGSSDIPHSVIKFISNYEILEISDFYEQLRKKYNNKKSKLFINIVKEIEKPEDVITTLSSLLLQILLYSNHIEKIETKQLFLNHARADDISKVLLNYFTTYDLRPCINVLGLIKADLKCLLSNK